MRAGSLLFFFFFFNDTATTEIYTLSLHDALPISRPTPGALQRWPPPPRRAALVSQARSEEHTSELQSQSNLVCRLLLEKKKNTDLAKRLQHFADFERSDAPSALPAPLPHAPTPIR